MFYQEVITKVSNVKLYILMYPFRSVYIDTRLYIDTSFALVQY